MTVYQLVAVGKLRITGQSIMLYSDEVYRTETEAEAAIPAYKKNVARPQPENETMEVTDNPLRVFIKPLEVLQGEVP